MKIIITLLLLGVVGELAYMALDALRRTKQAHCYLPGAGAILPQRILQPPEQPLSQARKISPLALRARSK